jgi:6-pyruvoyltetrahydropterin/6-carboxytetrahydropterin synthase
MHGHTYHLEVGISGVVDEKGFVMDFGEIKDIINPYIELMDHKVLNELPDKTILGVDFPTKTTAENMVIWLYKELAIKIAGNSKMTRRLTLLRLWETPTSYAEWRQE